MFIKENVLYIQDGWNNVLAAMGQVKRGSGDQNITLVFNKLLHSLKREGLSDLQEHEQEQTRRLVQKCGTAILSTLGKWEPFK